MKPTDPKPTPPLTNPNPARLAACPLLALAIALAPSPGHTKPREGGSPSADLALGPAPAAPSEATPPTADELDRAAVRRAFSISTGLAGAGLLVGGLILWNRGRTDFASTLPGLDPPSRDRYAADRLLFDTRAQWVGVGLATGGLGVGVVSLTEALGGSQRALLTEAGVGAAFTGGGVLGIQLLKQRHQPWTQVTGDELERRRDVITPFYAILGAGVGMATAALGALIIHRALDRGHKRRSALTLRGTVIHF